MRFVHSTVWRILFYLFVYYYMSVVFYKHPISVAYVNVLGETYAEVGAYIFGAMEAAGLVVEAHAAFHPYHRT